MADACDHWSEARRLTCPLTTYTNTSDDWAKTNGYEANQSDLTLATRAVASGPSGATNWSELPWLGSGPADVAIPGVIGEINDMDPVAIEDNIYADGPVQSAFWALLKSVGYEVW